MSEQIDIWQVGNTGLRNPNRIQEGFKVFAGSPFVGNLHGKDNELGFMNYLNEKGIIQNEDGKDGSGSHARKWRLMFAKNGFIYPQIKKKDGNQEELGILDDITPFGRSFLKADTYPAVQECYLRAMSVEQFALPDGIHYFSPLRWLLANLLFGATPPIRAIIFLRLSIISLTYESAELQHPQSVRLIKEKSLSVVRTMTRRLITS